MPAIDSRATSTRGRRPKAAKERTRGKLVALVRDGSAASRVTRRANALVRWLLSKTAAVACRLTARFDPIQARRQRH